MPRRSDISEMEEGESSGKVSIKEDASHFCSSSATVQLIQKIIAEVVGTYFLVFCGCGSVVVNKIYGSVTFPGVAVVWGVTVMVMVYAVGHISGALFNPAVTITFAIFRQFPYKQARYQCISWRRCWGQFLVGSGTLYLLLEVHEWTYFGTLPVGPQIRSFVFEIIISFLLMFVISGVATDNRAVGELAGIAIGMTIMLNVFIAGPVTGASMNPARSLGPAIVMNKYTGIWIYVLAPLIGAIFGGFVYNLIRVTDKPLRELTKSSSILKSFTGL